MSSITHRRIWEGCGALAAAGKPIDVVTVATWLRDHERLTQVGGIPQAIVPLLSEMHAAADGTGLVCRGIASQRAMARGLRTWLRKAGVDRTALITSTSVSLPIRWHDLRATCGTWMAVAGCAAHEIRDVLGHTQTAMTDRYVRAAASVRGGHFGEPFPALPAIGANRHRIVSDDFGLPMLPESHGYLRGGRDSNPRPPA